MRPVVKPLLAVVLALASVTACSDDNPEAAETPDTTIANSGDTEPPDTTTPHESDGVLRIGVLLPQTGVGAALGIPGTNAASVAVDVINEAGGVFGEDVQLDLEDEGESMQQAGDAIDRLVAANVDAIVGPASSLVALEYLDELMASQILTCSPLATSMALDNFPDRDLFFRTISSDSQAASGLALQAERSGVTKATVVYVDEAFARPMAREVIDSLRRRGVSVEAELPLPVDVTDYSTEAATLAEAETGTIIVVADSSRGWAMLTAMADVLDDPPRIIINDAMREPPSAEQVQALPEVFRMAIEGISQLGTPQEAREPVGPFATNSHDCVNLIALAAFEADSDDAEAIAREIPGVSDGGAGCITFEDCLDGITEGRDIDYDGPGERFSISAATGDPPNASLMLFNFDESGIATDLGAVRFTD